MRLDDPSMGGLLFLSVPWDVAGQPELRTEPLSGQSPSNSEAAVSPLLFSEGHGGVLLNGRSDTVEPLVGSASGQRERWAIWDLPVPLHAAETQTLRHESWRADMSFTWRNGVDRPTHRDAEEDGEQEPGWPWHRFLMAVTARMQDFRAALPGGDGPSDVDDPLGYVLDRWIGSAGMREPTMDILVRHAAEHRARWSEIADHPRRHLNRRREAVSLSRVQELDTQCMEWLSRQPGMTLAERAGGRQRILALARYENRNTLENRIFRDLLERTVAACREYLDFDRSRAARPEAGGSRRSTMVRQYGRECRRLATMLEAEGVTRAMNVAQPNYVLLHDNRYRYVWTAWQEIIRHERVLDDLWRWQRRSWAEFCRMAVVVALQVDAGARCVAASPLCFRPEHGRGEWLLSDEPIAVFAHEEKGSVVEVFGARAPGLPNGLRKLAADAWLRCSRLSGDEVRLLPIWAIHDLVERDRGLVLSDLAASADEALRRLDRGPSLAGGVVCLSSLDPNGVVKVDGRGLVKGFRFGPWDSQLSRALERMGDELWSLMRT